jgi:cell division transport system permease protein
MRALRYFLDEAAASLWRGRGAALLAIGTIAVGLFVLGFFLLVNTNLQGLVDRWSEAAELSVYLADDISPDALQRIDDMVKQGGMVSRVEYVSKAQAVDRFKADFPDLGATAGAMESNPLPASYELQLRPEARDAAGAVDGLVTALSGLTGVADVRYDREWLGRLNTVIRGARVAGAVVVGILALAAAMTVANVVRLAAAARRDEIEILQLVGAPFAYVRGPLVTEGILQGGIGALLAIGALAAVFYVLRLRLGETLAGITGVAPAFLSPPLIVAMVVGGMALGCIGGFVVARSVR